MTGVWWGVHRRRLLQVAKQLPRIRRGVPIAPHSLPVEIAHVGQWFHAISQTTRLGILEFLSQRARSVTELQETLGVPQSTVSYHLKVLRDGRWKYFSLQGQTLEHMRVFTHKVDPGAHVGTCPLTCCRS